MRGGDEREIEAQYLVGSDGGASTVRQSLGIAMSGAPTLTYTTNVVFRCEGLERLHDKKPGYRFIFIGPEGTWATLVAINGRDQWRFSLVGDRTQQTHSEEYMRRAIVRAVGRDFDFEILSMLPWIRRQLVADSYGRGRVFIAGDAAHLTSPTGGFGMNTGIQDAVNLSWKLAACIDGWGGGQLLDSYGVEQRPVAIRNVAEATGNLERMLSSRVQSPPKEIFEDGPGSDEARSEFGNRYTEAMRREWFSIGIHLGYVYEGSPIIVPDGTPPPPDEVMTYRQTARPGLARAACVAATGQVYPGSVRQGVRAAALRRGPAGLRHVGAGGAASPGAVADRRYRQRGGAHALRATSDPGSARRPGRLASRYDARRPLAGHRCRAGRCHALTGICRRR